VIQCAHPPAPYLHRPEVRCIRDRYDTPAAAAAAEREAAGTPARLEIAGRRSREGSSSRRPFCVYSGKSSELVRSWIRFPLAVGSLAKSARSCLVPVKLRSASSEQLKRLVSVTSKNIHKRPDFRVLCEAARQFGYPQTLPFHPLDSLIAHFSPRETLIAAVDGYPGIKPLADPIPSIRSSSYILSELTERGQAAVSGAVERLARS
jgi:hypothetical protein